MRPLILSLLLTSPTLAWSEEAAPKEMLPKASFDLFAKHAGEFYDSSAALLKDLGVPIQDRRMLLHLPRRGFPGLAALLKNEQLQTWAGSTLFMPEINLPSGSREEAIAGELLARAMVIRLAANQYACIRLVKELAPSPEALRLENQAKDLLEKMSAQTDAPSEAGFLASLESTRSIFDQSKDLPRMTPEEFAREQAESAVLMPE